MLLYVIFLLAATCDLVGALVHPRVSFPRPRVVCIHPRVAIIAACLTRDHAKESVAARDIAGIIAEFLKMSTREDWSDKYYVSALDNASVRIYSIDGGFIKSYGLNKTHKVCSAKYIAISPESDYVSVACSDRFSTEPIAPFYNDYIAVRTFGISNNLYDERVLEGSTGAMQYGVKQFRYTLSGDLICNYTRYNALRSQGVQKSHRGGAALRIVTLPKLVQKLRALATAQNNTILGKLFNS